MEQNSKEGGCQIFIRNKAKAANTRSLVFRPSFCLYTIRRILFREVWTQFKKKVVVIILEM